MASTFFTNSPGLGSCGRAEGSRNVFIDFSAERLGATATGDRFEGRLELVFGSLVAEAWRKSILALWWW